MRNFFAHISQSNGKIDLSHITILVLFWLIVHPKLNLKDRNCSKKYSYEKCCFAFHTLVKMTLTEKD